MPMLTILPISKISPEAYDAFLATQPDALPYHSRAWVEVLRRSYRYQPLSLVAQQADGKVLGILPLMGMKGRLKGRRLVSLPFSHCVPLLTASPEVRAALLENAVALANEGDYSYLELKTREPVEHDAFQCAVLNHISELDLTPSLDELYAAFSQNNRRNIKRAESAGFSVRIGDTPEDFRAFYRLEVATRHRQGAPIYPARFFRDIATLMPGQVRLYLLSYTGRDVAGLVIFHGKTRAIYAYGGSVRDDEIAQLRPNNWLMWQAIQDAKTEGCTVFDFGTTPLHHESLLAFKQHFRPQHHELAYSYYLNTRPNLPIIQRDSPSIKLVETGLRWMPRPLFKLMSPFLLREVG